jgi:hypothetical protein
LVRRSCPAHLADQLEPVAVRQIEIHHDDVRLHLGIGREAARQAVGGPGLVAAGDEIALQVARQAAFP